LYQQVAAAPTQQSFIATIKRRASLLDAQCDLILR
jgi:hypothetical protein